jgi:hypothetical protein
VAVTVKSHPHFTISAEEFAGWLEAQPNSWWFVDGDPVLTGEIDFPCPSDELAEAMRSVGKKILILDKTPGSHAQGTRVIPEKLNDLADRDNRLGERTFLCCWEDSDVDWLLCEDTVAAAQAG